MNSQDSITAEPEPRLAIIALGANIASSVGAPEITLQTVLADLRKLGVGDMRVSSFLRSTPVDCPPESPDFCNAVVTLEIGPSIGAMALLRKLQGLEQRYGRQPESARSVNAPRPLDLDLIALGNLQLREPGLELPHPRAHQRRFVLAPLAELLPDYVLPGQCVPVQALLAKLSGPD